MNRKSLIKHPELFQGRRKRKNYFEGWYYKIVSSDLKKSIAFIPGISYFKNDSHCFIQVILFSHNESDVLFTDYIRYKIEDFSYTDNPFSVKIGNSVFTREKISIDIKTNKCAVKGEIKISDITEIKKKKLSPNIMGIFGYLRFMECNHGVISMSNTCNGKLKINEHDINIKNGKGYIEKDWGRSFPKEYVWIQTNNFIKNKDASLMLSVAKIPFLGVSFNGFIVNFVFNNKEYRFATYNFAKMKLVEKEKDIVKFEFRKKKYILKVTGLAFVEATLPAPKSGSMDHEIKEGLFGIVDVILCTKKGEIIFEDKGLNAGIEIVYRLDKREG